MLKTMSAALLAVSMIAAPAFAAETGKTVTQAPVIKADQSQTKLSAGTVKRDAKADVKAKTDVKADAKSKTDAKAKAMNANASITPDQRHKTVRVHRHHHHKMASKHLKTQPDLGTKTTAPAPTAKRG